MNLHELDRYKLSDAVKFNARLNPKLWGKDEHLKPEVRDALMKIADDFRTSLGVDNLNVKDITVSGSNAAYTYTPNSDIDLHLVVDLPEADTSEVYRELFDAKKYAYNNQHNIKIGGYDVELYVQNANESPVSQGEYSLLNNNWIQVPRRQRADVVDTSTRSKYQDLKQRIKDAVKSQDYDVMAELMTKIRHLRQSGLDAHGEFGPENLAFKMLRTQGYIKQLADARTAAKDQELSIDEQAPRFTYGFGSGMNEDENLASANPQGMPEEAESDLEKTIDKFARSCIDYLGIKKAPEIKLHTNTDWSEQTGSFGQYEPETNVLHLATSGRHVLDILRTMAHEFTHRKQAEKETLPADAGKTGSPYEDEANAMAGRIMRHWAEKHPEMFAHVPLEEASGYIPTKKQAKDPRFVMALTKDVRPGAVGKEANKLGLQTDSQGHPALLTATLNESLAAELASFKEQDLFEVKMTSKNLANLAKDIKGVKVGLEFEMIVPNTDEPEDQDMEPDYDQDERVRDIDDAVNFFDDGDFNGPRSIRDLRSSMIDDYQTWVMENMDESWYGGDGFDYFKDYLDREDPFDEEEAEEEARNQLQSEYGDELDTEEFEKMLFALVDEKRENYVQEQWDEQGRNFDNAREEFEEEQRDNYSEQDWLNNESIRYASDVESRYGNVTWPYYTSSSDAGEQDIENVALNFMNAMGMDSVAVSSSYHGSYKKWVGNGWVNVGSTKPDDCFSIEPDGSLEGDSDSDAGLEFVSPPIPLEDIGTVMKKVQAWAADNGVYTGKNNKTSIHTNISVPGYDIKNLDYLKAALLLGDEHVLREFDRVGNTYAKPAIEKVRQLVKSNPDKAKQLLDKMKSQLNAEASKLIHSGITDKFTSINTKDNRIEFRSPGGDYLSIIADNPQKMVDTINRMVVTMDAAMDPNKYKDEYQKKLYKMLTGQESGREAKSGIKKEMKKDDKDLLNIFSRYAAGELPKQALKSFVRQAQLQRKTARDEKPQQQGTTVAGRPNNPEGNWYLKNADTDKIFYRFNAINYQDAHTVLQQWKQENPDSTINAVYGQGRDEPAQQDSTGDYIGIRSSVNRDQFQRDPQGNVLRFPTVDRAHGYMSQHNLDRSEWRISDLNMVDADLIQPQQPAQQNQGNWGIWIDANNRFANQPGSYARGETPPLYRFPSREAAEQWIEQQRAARPNMRIDIDVREIPPRLLPGSTLDLQRQRAAAAQDTSQFGAADGAPNWELRRDSDREIVQRFSAPNQDNAIGQASDWVTANQLDPNAYTLQSVNTAQQQTSDQQAGGLVDVAGEQPAQAPRTLTTPGQGQQVFTGEWRVVDANGQELYRFSGVGNSQSDANRVAQQWAQRNMVRDEVDVVPIMGED